MPKILKILLIILGCLFAIPILLFVLWSIGLFLLKFLVP